ncbi:biotin--[acetyl-CoA-carboxylase] ligase [uncultured Algibacter sp.]|uniref:biotin--[acetyl-CoA-carboxylase] ligase n=1 Tax=uncultured Algibacter sp. TaxID=298659 RepID=UPI00263023C6|nr:biotin--[acetyl-CoA-carboxylase] ligase [uncultured Algibacter sp.]
MRIIKLNATNSTNSYLRALYSEGNLTDFTAVIAKEQTQGKGQMGALWESQAFKNLTFSVFKDVKSLPLELSFSISMISALSVLKTLQLISIPRLSVKWPNDILSADKKICGILIENVIKYSVIEASIIGIGLNVNQTEFENLPQASSLINISGSVYNLDELALGIIENLKMYFDRFKENGIEVLIEEYESHLFRKNKPSTFRDVEGVMFSGFIEGVSNLGKLQVKLEDHILKEYDLKEITLLY